MKRIIIILVLVSCADLEFPNGAGLGTVWHESGVIQCADRFVRDLSRDVCLDDSDTWIEDEGRRVRAEATEICDDWHYSNVRIDPLSPPRVCPNPEPIEGDR